MERHPMGCDPADFLSMPSPNSPPRSSQQSQGHQIRRTTSPRPAVRNVRNVRRSSHPRNHTSRPSSHHSDRQLPRNSNRPDPAPRSHGQSHSAEAQPENGGTDPTLAKLLTLDLFDDINVGAQEFISGKGASSLERSSDRLAYGFLQIVEDVQQTMKEDRLSAVAARTRRSAHRRGLNPSPSRAHPVSTHRSPSPPSPSVPPAYTPRQQRQSSHRQRNVNTDLPSPMSGSPSVELHEEPQSLGRLTNNRSDWSRPGSSAQHTQPQSRKRRASEAKYRTSSPPLLSSSSSLAPDSDPEVGVSTRPFSRKSAGARKKKWTDRLRVPSEEVPSLNEDAILDRIAAKEREPSPPVLPSGPEEEFDADVEKAGPGEASEDGYSSSEDEEMMLVAAAPQPFVPSNGMASDNMSLTPIIYEDDDGTSTEEERRAKARRVRTRMANADSDGIREGVDPDGLVRAWKRRLTVDSAVLFDVGDPTVVLIESLSDGCVSLQSRMEIANRYRVKPDLFSDFHDGPLGEVNVSSGRRVRQLGKRTQQRQVPADTGTSSRPAGNVMPNTNGSNSLPTGSANLPTLPNRPCAPEVERGNPGSNALPKHSDQPGERNALAVTDGIHSNVEQAEVPLLSTLDVMGTAAKDAVVHNFESTQKTLSIPASDQFFIARSPSAPAVLVNSTPTAFPRRDVVGHAPATRPVFNDAFVKGASSSAGVCTSSTFPNRVPVNSFTSAWKNGVTDNRRPPSTSSSPKIAVKALINDVDSQVSDLNVANRGQRYTGTQIDDGLNICEIDATKSPPDLRVRSSGHRGFGMDIDSIAQSGGPSVSTAPANLGRNGNGFGNVESLKNTPHLFANGRDGCAWPPNPLDTSVPFGNVANVVDGSAPVHTGYNVAPEAMGSRLQHNANFNNRERNTAKSPEMFHGKQVLGNAGANFNLPGMENGIHAREPWGAPRNEGNMGAGMGSRSLPPAATVNWTIPASVNVSQFQRTGGNFNFSIGGDRQLGSAEHRTPLAAPRNAPIANNAMQGPIEAHAPTGGSAPSVMMMRMMMNQSQPHLQQQIPVQNMPVFYQNVPLPLPHQGIPQHVHQQTPSMMTNALSGEFMTGMMANGELPNGLPRIDDVSNMNIAHFQNPFNGSAGNGRVNRSGN